MKYKVMIYFETDTPFVGVVKNEITSAPMAYREWDYYDIILWLSENFLTSSVDALTIATTEEYNGEED